MNIDEETLINIIRQEIEKVLEDLDLLMPLPLQAEPPARLPLTEPQQHIKESSRRDGQKRSKLQLAQALINSMTDAEQEQLFRHNRRFTWNSLLKMLAQVKTAEKGGK